MSHSHNYTIHKNEVIELKLTKELTKKPTFTRHKTFIYNNMMCYYINGSEWKKLCVINGESYIELNNNLFHKLGYDYQLLNGWCYEDGFYCSTEIVESYYSPTRLKINDEYKINIKENDYYIGGSYIKTANDNFKAGKYGMYIGSAYQYTFSLKNGVYNDGDLLVYNDTSYYKIPFNLSPWC